MNKDEQAKLSFSAAVAELQMSQIEAVLNDLAAGPCRTLDSILSSSPESGCSAPPASKETGHYVLSLAALTKNGYLQGNLKPVLSTKAMLNCRLYKGDFLISRSNTRELVGLVGIFNEERSDVSFPDTMMRLPVDEKMVKKRFLEIVLNSRRGRLHMTRTAAGTSESMKKINRRTLSAFNVPVPSLDVQKELITKVEEIRRIVISSTNAALHASRLRSAFIQSLTS